jgi:hypothetical protein
MQDAHGCALSHIRLGHQSFGQAALVPPSRFPQQALIGAMPGADDGTDVPQQAARNLPQTFAPQETGHDAVEAMTRPGRKQARVAEWQTQRT